MRLQVLTLLLFFSSVLASNAQVESEQYAFDTSNAVARELGHSSDILVSDSLGKPRSGATVEMSGSKSIDANAGRNPEDGKNLLDTATYAEVSAISWGIWLGAGAADLMGASGLATLSVITAGGVLAFLGVNVLE